MSVAKASFFISVSNEMVDDIPLVQEGMALAFVPERPKTRYHRVHRQGYRAAMEDIRSGRLVFEDGYFRMGKSA